MRMHGMDSALPPKRDGRVRAQAVSNSGQRRDCRGTKIGDVQKSRTELGICRCAINSLRPKRTGERIRRRSDTNEDGHHRGYNWAIAQFK